MIKYSALNHLVLFTSVLITSSLWASGMPGNAILRPHVFSSKTFQTQLRRLRSRGSARVFACVSQKSFPDNPANFCLFENEKPRKHTKKKGLIPLRTLARWNPLREEWPLRIETTASHLHFHANTENENILVSKSPDSHPGYNCSGILLTSNLRLGETIIVFEQANMCSLEKLRLLFTESLLLEYESYWFRIKPAEKTSLLRWASEL